MKPEADGRIVLQYVVKKSDLGTWKAKTDMTREEILSILPGKWSNFAGQVVCGFRDAQTAGDGIELAFNG